MELVGHLVFLLLIFAGIWVCAGFIVRAVDELAHRLHQNSFAVAFLLLGLLTSITEMSVAVNSTLNGTPHLSVGNLVGGSLVIFLLIIPGLAFFGKGIHLRHALSPSTLRIALLVIALPALTAMWGVLVPLSGVALIMAYGILLFSVARQQLALPSFTRAAYAPSLTLQLVKILAAGVGIFFISRLLVEESVYVASTLAIPTSLVGLLMLSVGTNTPEIMIAVRAVVSGKKEVAFGNYIGSAAINTLILGLLSVSNGRFFLDSSEFMITVPFTILGLFLFYRFSRTHNVLSTTEGAILAGLGWVFVLAQLVGTVIAH